ncbi:MAG: hypothetical protein A2Z90_03975 [Burkholderiales bacterium GWA2_64_37]|nr:MAG: hypothetical protein A2Z90_03975 [Burkholderiales bacterium GWA2_64_37]HCE93311.1 hypothetical protein [Acidovorax sp.]
MYLKKSEANDLLQSNFQALVTSLQAKNHLIADLSDGDDWSFVIKVQTLIERAVTDALLYKIGNHGLSKTLLAMPLVGESVSKLSLSKDLDITTSAQRRFITTMASLRNRLAHDPDYGTFNFDSYIVNLTVEQKAGWKRSIPWFAVSPDSMQTWSEHALSSPKAVIYVATFMLVGLMELSATEASVLRQVEELSVATTTELLRGRVD